MDRLLPMFVQDYLAGERDLDEVQSLIIDVTWDMADQVAPETLELAKQLDLCIAEYTGGHITENDLKGLLRDALGLTSFVITSDDARPTLEWRSASPTQRRTLVLG